MTRRNEAARDDTKAASVFERLQARDRRKERRILWGELFVLALMALLVAAYLRIA